MNYVINILLHFFRHFHPFLSVTCHFIDDSFNRCWRVLGAEPIHGEHTSNAISNKISEIFIDFGISPSQIHIFLRDAASSMCRAVEGFL